MNLSLVTFLMSSSLLLLLHHLIRRRGRDATARLPPGPRKLPIVGSLHHLVGRAPPHRSLAALAKGHGPVMHLQLGEVSTVVISSPVAAAEIMMTQDISFANRPRAHAYDVIGYGDKGLGLASYGPQWRELRKICVMELLSFKRVQSFRSIREEEALNFVRSIDAGSVVNLSRKFVQLTNDIVARTLVGGKCKNQEEFLRIVKKALEAGRGYNLVDLFPSSSWLVNPFSVKLKRLHRKLDGIMDAIIQEHRERKACNAHQEQEDLVDVLLRIQDDGSLPRSLSLIALVLCFMKQMFWAGSESSATTLEWAMSALMRNPAAMEIAQGEVREIYSGGKEKVSEEDVGKMKYLSLVIKETLRLHPPVPLLLPRESHETKQVLGYQIPAKTKVLVNAWALARDPQIWEDAEEFKPERFMENGVDFKGTNFEFIPFGAGRRICPGLAYGIASVQLLLACSLYYFDWNVPAADDAQMKIASDELDMNETFMLTSRRRSELCLLARRPLHLA